MRRPAGRLVTGSREAFGQHRPPATTSGTCERTNASRRRTPLMCTVPTSGQGGLGGHKPRGGAPRGVRPALSGARRFANACGPASLVRERVPMHPLRLSALRPLRGQKELCKPRRALCLAGGTMRARFLVARIERSEIRGHHREAKSPPRVSLRSTRATTRCPHNPTDGSIRAANNQPQSMPNWPLPRYPKHPIPIPFRPQDATFPFTLYPWCNSAEAAIRLRISPNLKKFARLGRICASNTAHH